jgi:ParB family chromosome partitioning protein
MSKIGGKHADSGNTIPIKRILIESTHIRRNIAELGGLKSTIADAGLLQPILVRQTDRGYTVIDGARRLQALRELGVEELIIGRDVVVEASETEADETFKQLIANVQREDVNDVELGHAFVALKESYGYQYNEIAEIIGKTPHYVAAKVGLAKRLTPEVQDLVVKDWEAAKRARNRQSSDSDDVLDPYVMNVNVIEDIARLPAGLQSDAYVTVRDREMDKKEALRYLKGVKRDAEVLLMADDVKGLMQGCIAVSTEQAAGGPVDVGRYIKKLDKDVERLFETVKSGGPVNKEQLIPALESLMERLNALYAEIKAGREENRAAAAK